MMHDAAKLVQPCSDWLRMHACYAAGPAWREAGMAYMALPQLNQPQ